METGFPALVPSLPSVLTEPLTALGLLLKAEEEDSKRIRVSKVNWWQDVLRVKGSTLPRIYRAVLGFTIWSFIVAVADVVYGKELGLTNNVTPLLSVVVGLLLVFRNGTAFARWELGRSSFSSMTATVRSLSRSVWINVGALVPSTRLTSDGTMKPMDDPTVSERDHRAKIDALRLMVAFVISVKHHVRKEFGIEFEDLRSVLPPNFVQIAGSGFGYDSAHADHFPTPPEFPNRNQFPEAQFSEYNRLSGDRTPLLRRTGTTTSHRSTESVVILSNYLSKPSLPLPLIIAHQLNLFVALAKKKGLLEAVGPAGYNALQVSITSLVDNFTAIERLSSIGIPTVYGIHLKQCVSLFLFTLPFTLVEIMGWKMIPFVTVCSFTLIGIEGIASELEDPFGKDSKDLPLDLICAELRNEIEHTISRLASHSEEWM